MTFSVSKIILYQALQRAIGAIPLKTPIPILSNFLLELSDNKLTITATDLELSISTTIPVTSEADGSVTIPAKILSDIIRELPDIPLTIAVDENYKMVINSDQGVYKITGSSRSDFPDIVMEEGEGAITINSKRLARLISKTIFAVSDDELRPALTGVLIELVQNEIRFVSTDGHRLVKISYLNFAAPEMQKSIIVPTKSFNLLLKNIGENEDEQIVVLLGEDHIVFKFSDTSIYSKLIEGQYPNYNRVIPGENNNILRVNKDLLNSSVRRVAIFSNSLTHQIRFSLGPAEMTIVSEDIEYGGEGKETLPVEYEGEPLEIGYNAVYVSEVLRHLDTEQIIIQLGGPNTAGIVLPAQQQENEYLMMLIMPIRLTEEAA